MADLATAYLRLIPSLQGAQKTIERELGGVNTKSTGDKLGGGLVDGIKGGLSTGKIALGSALGNVLSQSVDMAVGAVTGTLQNAFENIGTFEQLSGGVEKIFDQANTEQIFKDAQNAYKDLNMSANEYLDSINQVGATFAQTMGDQKGYDTARQGMKAIADYASGTGRNLDELNEKYKLITRSSSSYQSIADQFAGILPQTSKDFLAAAQNAGLLSTSYTELTQVPVAEYQQAVTQMLEKGVDDLGLLGNTAAESTGTLTGSIAMLQSSWQNLLTSFGGGDIEAAMKQVVDSIGAVMSNAIPVVGNILNGIGQAVQTFIPQIATYIHENKDAIANGAIDMFTGLINGLAAIAPDLLSAVVELLLTLVGKIIERAPDILTAVGTLMNNVVDGILGGIANAGHAMDQVMGGVLNAVGNFFNGMFYAGMELVNNIGSGISGAIGAVINAVTGVIQGAVDAVTGFVDSMFQAGASIVQGLIDGITSAIGGVADAIGEGLSAARNLLPFSPAKEGPFSGKGWTLYSGMSMMQGLADGIKASTGIATRQMQAAMDSVYTSATMPTAQIAAAVTNETGANDAGAAPANIGIYLDGKILVGYLAPGMDRALVVA